MTAAPMLGEPLPVELANTRFARRGREHEGLEAPADLARWLAAVRDRLPVALGDGDLETIGPAELGAAIELRDALRDLVGAATEGRTFDPDAAEVVNRVARAAPRWRELVAGDAPAAVPRSDAPAVATALGAIADEAVGLLAGPGADSLRACTAPGCILFYRKDHPRRAWCSPRCSDRVRAARQYARRKAAG